MCLCGLAHCRLLQRCGPPPRTVQDPPWCCCADCWLLLCPAPDSQASVNGHTKVAELLLGAGADPCLVNKEGRTAVDMAKTPELAQQLQAHPRHTGACWQS